MLVQAIAEYGRQVGRDVIAESGLAWRLAGTPLRIWAIAAGAGLLGLWLLYERRQAAGLTAGRLLGLGLLIVGVYLGSEHMGITSFGSPLR
jgi:hypothetical protein